MTESNEMLLKRALARLCRRPVDSLPREVPFSDFGVDSLDGLRLIGAIANELGIELDPMVMLDYPSIAALAAHLDILTGEAPVRAGE